MTDRELHDLLRQRVADVSAPDLSGRAWERAGRIRRRRAAGVVAGAVASVAVVAVALAGLPGQHHPSGPAPAPQPSAPTAPPTAGATGSKPDGHFRGRPVFWGPLVSQEATLPRAASPFPETVDLSAPAPSLTDDPIRSALAAYAIVDEQDHARLLLLAPDGSLRSVDTSRVAPYEAGTGYDISVAHDTLLSPTGEFLAFPQEGSVLVLTLATGEWRTVHVHGAPTTALHWLGRTDLWLPPTTQGGEGPMYSVVSGQRSGATNMAAPQSQLGPGSGPYHRWRMGPGGWAQSWAKVRGLPVPPGEVAPSQVLRVEGDSPAHDALLLYRSSAASDGDVRADFCCGVVFWLDGQTVVYDSQAQPRELVAWRVGTHEFTRVTTIEGYDPDHEVLVSSYARIWDR